MKITLKQFKQIVKEEVSAQMKPPTQLKEGDMYTFKTGKEAGAHVKRIADKYFNLSVKGVMEDKPDQKNYKDEPLAYQEDLRDWKEEVKKETKMYVQDKKDLYKLADMLARKQYVEAAKMINNLDTMVRDLVPRSVIRFLEKTDAKEHLD